MCGGLRWGLDIVLRTLQDAISLVFLFSHLAWSLLSSYTDRLALKAHMTIPSIFMLHLESDMCPHDCMVWIHCCSSSYRCCQYFKTRKLVQSQIFSIYATVICFSKQPGGGPEKFSLWAVLGRITQKRSPVFYATRWPPILKCCATNCSHNLLRIYFTLLQGVHCGVRYSCLETIAISHR